MRSFEVLLVSSHKIKSLFFKMFNALIVISSKLPIGVEIKRGSSSVLMSYGNRFAQLTTEAAENAARLVLSQLSERLSFSKHPSNNDEEMAGLQFGICSYQVQPQRVNF